MSEQDGRQAVVQQRPTTNDQNEWKAYWKAQGHVWRTEPEIDVERQEYLTQQQNIMPNIEQGIYPFKDIKLSRADVEWLLSKEESESNLAASKGETQHKRKRLDLRAANLSDENLSGLPLRGANLSEANLEKVHLEGTDLNGVILQGASLRSAFFDTATSLENG